TGRVTAPYVARFGKLRTTTMRTRKTYRDTVERNSEDALRVVFGLWLELVVELSDKGLFDPEKLFEKVRDKNSRKDDYASKFLRDEAEFLIKVCRIDLDKVEVERPIL